MSVTLDVLQLDMSALIFFKPAKSPLMSVMAQTFQSAMGPYVAVAASGSALNAWTAVPRAALVIKMVSSGDSGGEDGVGEDGGAGEGCVGGGKVGEGGGGPVEGDDGGQLPEPQLES